MWNYRLRGSFPHLTYVAEGDGSYPHGTRIPFWGTGVQCDWDGWSPWSGSKKRGGSTRPSTSLFLEVLYPLERGPSSQDGVVARDVPGRPTRVRVVRRPPRETSLRPFQGRHPGPRRR